MERKSHRKYLCQDLRSAQIIVNIYPKNTIIFTITQAQRKSHRKYLRWDLRSTWIIVNIIVNFWSKFTIIWAERKSHRKYLRWDLRSTRIIVNIYDNISVNIYDNDLWLLTLTCCRNGSKVLEPTPNSPVADQVKPQVLQLHRMLEGEVEQGGRCEVPGCVSQLVLN